MSMGHDLMALTGLASEANAAGHRLMQVWAASVSHGRSWRGQQAEQQIRQGVQGREQKAEQLIRKGIKVGIGVWG